MFEFASLVYRLPALLFAISIHEYAHAQAADSLGDPTARYQGRLTLNPLAHMDIVGALLMVMTGFGWAKPVEFDPRYFKNPKNDTLKVSLAGPAANLFLVFLAMLVRAIMFKTGHLSTGVNQLLIYMIRFNVWFAFFNLIPIPPLDGYRIITHVLPGKLAWEFEDFVYCYERYMILVLMLLVFAGITNIIIVPLANIYLSIVSGILGLIF